MTALDPLAAPSTPGPLAPGADLRPGDVDLSDPKTFVAGVPHEYFRVLREEDPVHWQEECELPVFLPGPGYWALTRYDDVVFVSKHPEIFSSAEGKLLSQRAPSARALAWPASS